MSTQLGKHLCFIFNVYFFSLLTRWSTKLNLTKVNYFLSEFWLFWSKVLRVKQVCVSTMLRLHICLYILGTPMAWSQFNKWLNLHHVKPLCCFVPIFTITLKVFELLLSGNFSWSITTVYFRVQRKSVLQLSLWASCSQQLISQKSSRVAPKPFWRAGLITQSFCNLNSSKNFTCLLGNLRTKLTSPIAKQH